MTAHSVPETTCTGSHITSGFIFPSDSTTGQNASSCCTTLVQLHQPGAEDSRGHDLDNQEVGAHAPATACPERRLTMTRRCATLVLLGLLVLPAAALAAPEGKIVIAQGVDPTTLDPQWHEETPAYNVLLNIYDTLLFRDKDLKIIPWLAESWKLVNPTTWEFKIRKGVTFHNGEEVDAEAVKFSLDRIRDPELKSRQAGYFRLITSIDVVDKHTIRIVTAKPYPTLENHLALRGHIMAPKPFRGKDKGFADRNPVGPVEGPTKDKRVRQAILAAVNADEIIKNVLKGNAIRTATPLTSKHFGFDRALQPVKFDPDRSKKLLVDAGFPEGIDLVLNSPDGRYQKDKEVAESVAGQLTRAGVRTRVKTHEWTTYLSQLVYPHKANPMYLIGWGNTTWDADGTLTPLFRSGSPQANYYSPDFDGLVDEAQTSVDELRATRPLSVTRKEAIDALRAWARARAAMAN